MKKNEIEGSMGYERRKDTGLWNVFRVEHKTKKRRVNITKRKQRTWTRGEYGRGSFVWRSE